MHRLLACAATAVGVLALGSSAAAQTAAQLPPCPSGDDLVTTYPPDYLRAGAPLAFSFEREEESAVGQVTVTYPGQAGVRSETFGFPEFEDEVRVIRPAPRGRHRFELRFAWQQNVGRPDACRGSDMYRAIPIVSRRAKVGRPEAARFSGHYRARYHGGDRARWTLRPTCDVFGCVTRFRSSGKLRGTMRPEGARRYRFADRERVGSCRLGFSDGTSRTYAIYGYTEISLRVVRRRSKDGVALRLEGRRVYSQAAPADDLDLCDTPANREVERVQVRRIGP